MSQTRAAPRALPPALAWLTRISPPMWLAVIVLAAVASLLPGLWTLIGLAGLVVCALIVIRPDLAVYLLALSVPLGSLYETKVVGNLTLSPTEVLAGLLAVTHNLYFYNTLLEKIREALDEDRFGAFRSEYSEKLAQRI